MKWMGASKVFRAAPAFPRPDMVGEWQVRWEDTKIWIIPAGPQKFKPDEMK